MVTRYSGIRQRLPSRVRSPALQRSRDRFLKARSSSAALPWVVAERDGAGTLRQEARRRGQGEHGRGEDDRAGCDDEDAGCLSCRRRVSLSPS